MIDFTEEQIQRYSRHILLQDVGVEGQEKIMNARVLVVGAGGLGAPVSLDGTDNFPVKFLINDACVMAGKPFSHGGILRFNGQTFTHLPGTACYRCMFKEPPPVGAVPTCSQAGVLGAIAGMLGTIQAAETLKYFTGIGELLTNRLLTFDAKTMQFRTVPVKHRDSCAICGTNPTIDHLIDYEQAACDLKNH